MLISPHLLGILGCLLIMAVIVGLGPYSDPSMFLEDRGFSWYYWKLPEPDFWTRFSAWFLYGLHQSGLWLMIAWAQHRRPEYVRGLHPINIIALGFNLLFVALHIAQTRFFYDGLAQDTSVYSSQFSVIFMLVFILIMENRRRGLLFGYRIGFMEPAGGFLRRYHGFYFSWAIVYTFWFHPIEDNIGHLLGTFYILLLLLQGSLFFTRFHRDRLWTMLLEVFVVFHGAMVAWLSFQNDHWQMFLFGFLGLFILTQMHGIGLGKISRALLLAAYLLAVLLNYWGRGWEFVEIFRIPGAELGLAAVIAGVIWLVLRLRRTSTA